MIKWNRVGDELSDVLMVSPMSFSVTVKDEEETEKDDRSHRAADNTRCPSSIILVIGIVTIPSNISNIGATTTSGRSSNAGRIAGRIALLVECVS